MLEHSSPAKGAADSMGGLNLAVVQVTALFVTDGRSTGSQAGGRIVPQAPESRYAINYPEPAATAAPPVPVAGGLS
jgi:hypothetical protein